MEPLWSATGNRLLYLLGMGSLYVWDGNGSDALRMPQCDHCVGYNGAAWSPDGTHILAWGTTTESGDVFLIDVERQSVQALLRGPADDCCASWQPDAGT